MACDLATTQAAACESGIGKLDGQVQLLQAIAQSFASWLETLSPESDLSLAAIMDRACESGIGNLNNPISLLQVIAQNLESVRVQQIVDSFVERSGITDQTQIDAVTQLVIDARNHCWWDLCDLIYPFVGGTAAAHAENLKSSSFTITWAGTVTHNANGVTGNGTDGYGATGYIPSSSGQMQLNSAHISLYPRTLSSTTSRYYCGSGFTPRTAIQHGSTADTFRFYGNDTTAVNQGPISVGYVMGSRFSSAERHIFNAGADRVHAQPSVAVAITEFFLLALNNTGVAASFNNANLAFLTVGSGITFTQYQTMQSDIQTFQTALGRAV